MSVTNAPAAGSGVSSGETRAESGSWFYSQDHRRIGIIYLCVAGLALVAGTLLAAITSMEAAGRGMGLVSAETWTSMVSMHGIIMVFLLLLPAIPAGLGSIALPGQIGAENLALPRLSRTSLHVFLIGLLLILVSAAMGGTDAGWTFPGGYSVSSGTAVLITALAAALVALSMFVTSLNLILSIHARRGDGVGWWDLPLSSWGIYFGSWLHVIATPVLLAALGLLAGGRFVGLDYFDPAAGRDILLYENLVWFYATPVVLLAVLPAVGFISDVLAASSGRRPSAYGFVVGAMAVAAVLALFSWGGQVLTLGGDPAFAAGSSLISLAFFVPVFGIVLAWIATLYGGAIRLTAAMHYALFGAVFLVIGAVSGLFTSSMGLGALLRASVFSTAQFHYLVVGTTLMAALAGVHHLWERISGRGADEKIGRAGAVTLFIGLNLAFFPMFSMGIEGLPQRTHEVGAEFLAGSFVSSAGTYVSLLGILLALGNLLRSLPVDHED